VSKREPYGFVGQRPNFMSVADQTEELIAYGVLADNILNPENGVDEAVRFCEPGEDLVVYSATVFGTVTEYDRVIKALAKGSANLVIIRAGNLSVSAVDTLPYIKGKKDLNLRNAALGREHGRKKSISRAKADKIIHFVKKQGNKQIDAAKKYGTSAARVSEIMNGTYFKTTGRSK